MQNQSSKKPEFINPRAITFPTRQSHENMKTVENTTYILFVQEVISNDYPHVQERYLKSTNPFQLAKIYQKYRATTRATSWFFAALPCADRLKRITNHGHFFILFEYFRSNNTQSDDPNLKEFITIVQAASDKIPLPEQQFFVMGNEYNALSEPLFQYCKDNPSAMQTKAKCFLEFIKNEIELKDDEFSKKFINVCSGKKESNYHSNSNDSVTFQGGFSL